MRPSGLLDRSHRFATGRFTREVEKPSAVTLEGIGFCYRTLCAFVPLPGRDIAYLNLGIILPAAATVLEIWRGISSTAGSILRDRLNWFYCLIQFAFLQKSLKKPCITGITPEEIVDDGARTGHQTHTTGDCEVSYHLLSHFLDVFCAFASGYLPGIVDEHTHE